MFTVKFLVAVLGIGVLCTAQSDAEDVHERVQNLHHSDAMNDSLACSNCTDPLKECRDAYVAEFLKLDDIHKKCPILSKYVDCVSEVRQYDQDDKIKVLKKLRARMKKERIYCDFGLGPDENDQDGNGGPSMKKSVLQFVLMGLMVTFGIFIFRG